MLAKISNRIADNLIASNVIGADEKEIYTFGAEVLISYIINLLTIIVLGLALSAAMEGLVFLSSYALIRMYAGGYHASTFGRCYALSVVIMVVALMFAVYLFPCVGIEIIIALMAASGIGIYAIGPVDNKNRKISQTEKKAYRQKTAYMLISEAVAAALLHAAGLDRLTFMVFLAWMLMLLMCLVEKWRSIVFYRDRKREEGEKKCVE